MPAAVARASPSASAWLSPKIRVFTASFIAAPVPSGPRWKSVALSASRTGRARSRSSASPPTMIVSLPASASPTLPDTGVSSRPAPAARAAASWARNVAGGTVDASRTGPCRVGRRRSGRPGRRRRRRPPRRWRASRRHVGDGRDVPRPVDGACRRSGRRAPRAASGVRFQSDEVEPGPRSAWAIAEPIRPVPSSPTVVIPASPSHRASSRRRLIVVDDPLDASGSRGPRATDADGSGMCGVVIRTSGASRL